MGFYKASLLLAAIALLQLRACTTNKEIAPSLDAQAPQVKLQTPMETASVRGRVSSLSYPVILKKIIPAMLGKISPEETMDILEEHFFTSIKENSIWPMAIDETVTNLHASFDARTLFDLQTAVKNIYRKLLQCQPISKPRRRAKCFVSALEVIEQGQYLFALPRQSDKDQAHLLQVHVAFQTMVISILHIIKSESEAGKMNDLKAAKMILDIGEELFDTLEALTDGTIKWRVNEVDQPELCTMQEVLWQQFPIACHYFGPSSRSKRQVDESMSIGGTSKKLSRLYRVHVVDKLTGKSVFNETMPAPKRGIESVPDKLLSESEKARSSYVDQVEAKMEAFYKERTVLVLDQVQNIWDKNQSKLKAMKDRIENKHLI